jgi:Fe-S cluster assembly scaffold protein SufB
VAAQGVPALDQDGGAEVGQRPLSRYRLPEHRLLLGAENRGGPSKSLDEVDPELLRTYEKLGIPLKEQAALAGVAVDAVFDSVSVATTFKEKLAEMGIIFCSFSEAVQHHPELIEKYLGSVVPHTDNFFEHQPVPRTG